MITSTLVTGAFGIAVVALTLRVLRRRSYSPAPSVNRTGSPSTDAIPDAWSLLVGAYVLVVLGALVGTLATVDGPIEGRTLVAGLGAVVAVYLVIGVYFADGIRRTLARTSYRLKKSVLFRRRPLWSMMIGWATFGAILLAIGALVVVLWTIGVGPVGFVVLLLASGILVALYAASSVGVRS